MMFKRTAISLCLFSLFASGAYAEPTLVNSVIEDQADIDALNLSADGDKDLKWNDNTYAVHVLTGTTTSLAFTGNGKNSLTMTAGAAMQGADGTDPYAFRFDQLTGDVTFSNFKNVKLTSTYNGDVPAILTFSLGTTTFGSAEAALESLSFENLQLGKTWEGNSSVDIYAKNFSLDTALNVNSGFNINIQAVGEGQQSQLKSVSVKADGEFNVYGGSLTVDDFLHLNNGASITLGTKDNTLATVTLGTAGTQSEENTLKLLNGANADLYAGTVNVNGTTYIYGSETKFNANVGNLTFSGEAEFRNSSVVDLTVSEALAFNESLTIAGNADVSASGGVITIGAVDHSEAGQILNLEGTLSVDAEKFDVYGDSRLNGGITATGGSYVFHGDLRTLNSTATFGSSDAYLESFKVEGSEATSGEWNHGFYIKNHVDLYTNNFASDAINLTAGSALQVTALNTTIESNQRALSVSGDLTFNAFDGENASEQKLTVITDNDQGAVLVSDGSLKVLGGSLSITGTTQVNHGSIELGNKDSALQDVTIVQNAGAVSAAALRSNRGTINVTAENIYIAANDNEAAVSAFSLSYDDREDGKAEIQLNAAGDITIEGNVTAGSDETKDVVSITNQSLIVIDGAGTTTINGDLKTWNGQLDSEKFDQDISSNVIRVNLSGEQSQLNGAIIDVADSSATGEVGTYLNLTDQATWNVAADSTLKSLASDGGLVTTNGHQVTVDTITNELGGTTIETTSGEANQIKVARVVGDGLEIHLTDDTAKDLDASDLPGSLASVADIGQTDSDVTITSDEYGVYGDMEVVLGENGEAVSFTEAKNTVTQGLQDIAANNFLFFRSQMNDVSKRMGDLRSMPSAAGAWARYYGGEMKYGDMDMESRYNTLQIGADQRFGNFYLGLSASYSDGNGTLANGSTDDKNYNFGVYGGWVADNGQYVDVIVKRHRLETDATLYYTSGLSNNADYNNWATSLSVEYGWRFNCPSTGFYVEPQAELLYGRMDSVDFTTSRGVNVSQDAIDTLVGRLGAAIGYTFDDNRGSAYFTASVLHDWKAETDTTVRYNGISRHYQDDLGGTWGEFSLGGTYNVTDSFSAYGDVMTTTGSPVRNPWQISVGVRYTF